MNFIGRSREMRILARWLGQVESALGSTRPGQCLIIRGRRRIGKSSLVEAFLHRAKAPAFFYTATGAAEATELADFIETAQQSTLPSRSAFSEAAPGNWSTALRLLAEALPSDRPSVVVIDELPYLVERVDAFEGILQRAWDRELSRKPVLLVLIGSDLSMMEALTTYGRPFHQRGHEMVVGPLDPAEVGQMLRLRAADAVDAALITGGLPLICAAWRPGTTLWRFLGEALSDPVSPLLVSAERSLAAEFPTQAQARAVLSAIGSGERTFGNIQRAVGDIPPSSLTRSTELLSGKGMVAAELPVSTRPSRERRYRVTDPYLRFWLTFLGPYAYEIERGRGDLTLRRIRSGWTSWRGRAVEPLVRESLARKLPDENLPAAPVVGGYWTRSNDVEIDLVGADRAPVAKTLLFLGSIKWHDTKPFGARDLLELQAHRARISDAPLPLVAVSRNGVACEGLSAAYGPEDLLAAWSQSARHDDASSGARPEGDG